jgi:hypothetical protein
MMRLLGPRFHAPISAPIRQHHRSPVLFARRRSMELLPALTPLCDALLGVVILLLHLFAVPDGCLEHKVRQPSARNVTHLIEAPLVTITPAHVFLDEAPADGELRSMLQNKRELWRQTNPGVDCPGVVILRVDAATPASLVKQAVRSATMAGYPHIGFEVRPRGA